jgi:hypothetical protein
MVECRLSSRLPPPNFLPPFSYYPHPPLMQYPHQPHMQFQGAGQGPGQQQQLNEYRQRPLTQNNQGFRPSEGQQRQRPERQEESGQEETTVDAAVKVPEVQSMEEENKQPKVTCFNYAEFGHFSTDCRAPKLCFICQTTNHVGRDCPDWLRPLEPAQYLGSAAQGLGFFMLRFKRRRTKVGI